MADAAAVIVAGGAGRRFGGAVPKQFLPLAGRPVLYWTISAFVEHPAISTIVVVLPPGEAASTPGWLASLGVRIAAGGAERADSVWNGLMELPAGTERVLLHDGARPLPSRALIDRVLAAVGPEGVVPVIPIHDAVKEVDGAGVVLATLDRDRLRAAQTPQGFPLAALIEAHRLARQERFSAPDDAAVFSRFAGTVRTVPGEPENVKITVASDLVVATALLESRRAGATALVETNGLE